VFPVEPDGEPVEDRAAAAPLRLLIVEDVAADVELEMRELLRAGIAAECRVVDTEDAMTRAIDEYCPDVIVSDFAMPHFDGLSALEIARRRAPETPFVFVSGTVGEETAIRALHAGASDYVLKANLRRLPPTIERCVKDARLRAHRRAVEAALARLQERLRAVFTSLPDVLYSATLPSERMEFVSPACESVYGHSPEAFEQDPALWKALVHADDRARVEEAWQRALVEGGFDIEYRIARSDGVPRWVNHRGHVVRDASGVRFDGIIRDVTGAVRDRQRLARLAEIHAWLADTNAAIVRIRQERELLQDIVQRALRIGDVVGATATIFDVGDAPPHFAVRAGITPHPDLATSAFAESVRHSAVRALAVSSRGEPRIENDVARAVVPDRDELLARGIAGTAAFPLTVDGRVAGELEIFAGQPGYFEPAVARLLREVAGNLSLAITLLRKQSEADWLALFDPLTGLPNRAFLRNRLPEFIGAAIRGETKLALVLLEVERLRDINMLGGQQAGDEVLRLLGNRLRAMAGDDARIARLAGDHFAFVVGELTDATTLPHLLFGGGPGFGDVRCAVNDREIEVTVRAGVAVCPGDGADADTLFHAAESALDDARATRSRIAFCSPQIKAAAAERVEIEHLIAKAMNERRFVLHYQPKVNLANGHICGVEALLRIDDPIDGLIGPQRFVGVLEQSPLIDAVGRFAIEEALRAQARWRARTGASPRVAVNVSAVQLLRDGFVDVVSEVLRAAEPDACLEVEITESVVLDDLDAAVRVLRHLRELGVTIALDDFGTGYSSLRYLSAMPLDTLKIDRSFVAGLPESAEYAGIANAILSLGSALDLMVVAEGVETEAQAHWLRERGCGVAQGYLFARPQPEAHFADAWHAHRLRHAAFMPSPTRATAPIHRSR
jgi:diguanylate cyclase (GGDEF)-like protein/PAS domain S-box-containing protein